MSTHLINVQLRYSHGHTMEAIDVKNEIHQILDLRSIRIR